MGGIVPEQVERYTEAHTTAPAGFLVQLAEETRAELEGSEMLTGTVEGRLLEMLVFAAGAKRILEIGTYSGYAALSMASVMPLGGRVITCEANPEHAAFARERIAASPYASRIEIREGPALETLPRLSGPFDLVFIDADKPNYRSYYEAVLPLLADSGLIVVDNTLWGGRVLDSEDQSANTLAIRELNDFLAADERVTCVQLPVRDGITIVRRAPAV